MFVSFAFGVVMDCTEVREMMIESLGSASTPNSSLAAHLAACADCASVWAGLQATSAAMNDWTAPEPSPFFNTRFQARLAEVKRDEANAPAGIFGWLKQGIWRPAMAAALTLALAIGVGLYQHPAQKQNNIAGPTQVSPAVNDLQKLDKDEDLYADFELLDDLQTQQSQPAAATSGSKTQL
jgi:hypothetical protein